MNDNKQTESQTTIDKMRYLVDGKIETEKSAHLDNNGDFVDHINLMINGLYFSALDGTGRFKTEHEAINAGKELQQCWKKQLASV